MPVELPRAQPAPSSHTDPSGSVQVMAEVDGPWCTVVWNDPVNLMSYVTYVFQAYFGYAREQAETLMMQVHHEGRAVVSTGPLEKMEADVAAMHAYGLWATLATSGGAA